MNGIGDTASPLTNSTTSGQKRPWEHPWTIEEMRNGAANWKLASDVGMLLHLEAFTHRLLSRTHDIQEQVDSVIHEAKLTNVRINNVFNDFIMLANTQFVENRVYDEEVTSVESKESEETKEPTKEQREAVLLSRVRDALNLGLNVLDTDFEKIDLSVDNSESEDEDSTVKVPVMFEPKDPYIHRALPFLIGSEEFDRSDDVGLGPGLTDGEEEPRESESDELRASLTVDVVTTNGPPAPRSQPAAAAPFGNHDSSSEEDDDLFGDARKVVSGTKSHDEVDQTSQNGGTKVKTQEHKQDQDHPDTSKRKKLDDGDLFGQTEDDDADDDIFSKPTGLFTASRGSQMFADEDKQKSWLFGEGAADNGLPTDKQNNANKDTAAGTSATKVSSVTTDDAHRKETPVVVSSKGLFDDDGDDLFAVPVSKPQQKHVQKKANLFGDDGDEDEDNGDLFSEANKQTTTSSSRKMPAGAVPLFGSGGDQQFKAAISQRADGGKSQKADSQQEVDSTKPAGLMPKPLHPQQQSLIHSESGSLRGGSASPSTMSSNSLFADEPEILSSGSHTKTQTPQPTATSRPVAGSSLFGAVEDDDDDGDLFSVLSKGSSSAANAKSNKDTKPKLLMEDDGDLFSSPSQPSSKATTESRVSSTNVETSTAASKPTTQLSPRTTLSLFDDDDNEGDLFAISSKVKVETAKQHRSQVQQPKSSGNLSLFADDLLFATSDDDPSVDLFAPASKTPVSPSLSAKPMSSVQPSAVSAASSMSTSDVILPSASKPAAEVNVSVSSKTSGPAATTATSNVLAENGAKSTGGLFDDLSASEEEEDLFATLTKKKPGGASLFTDETDGQSSSSSNAAQKSVDAGDKKSSVKPPVSVKSGKQPLFDIDQSAGGKNDTPRVSPGRSPEDLPANVAKKPPPGVAPKPSSPHSRSDAETNEPVSETSRAAVKTSNRISQLQASMAINPAALLPSRSTDKSPVSLPKPVTADLDQPVQIQTLQSVAKDRAKIQTKRRPPSRQHLQQSASAQPADGGNKPTSLSSVSEADVTDSQQSYVSDFLSQPASPLPVVDQNVRSSQQTHTEVLDDIIIPAQDDSLATTESVSSGKASSKTKDVHAPLVSPDAFGFSLPPTDTSLPAEKKTKVPQAGDDDADDIFADSPFMPKSLKKPQSTVHTSKVSTALPVPTSPTSKVTAAIDDDIFADIIAKPTTKTVTSKKDDTSDIFFNESTSSANSSSTIHSNGTKVSSDRSGNNKPTVKVLVGAADDDEDIFGSFASGKPPAKTSSALSALSADADDIFADIPSGKAPPAKRGNQGASVFAENGNPSKPSSILSSTRHVDSDDLFADITSSKSSNKKEQLADASTDHPAPSKATAVTQASAAKLPVKSIFDEDDDDIFAVKPKPAAVKDISTEKTPPKSSTVRKKYVTRDEDLFGDSTDIFSSISQTKPQSVSASVKSQPKTKTVLSQDTDDIFAETPQVPKSLQAVDNDPLNALGI